jgi:DNA/RNA-binding protein KIN17
LKNLDHYNLNPDKYKELNSQEFADEFMHILENRHPSSTVPALKVYHQTIGSRRNVSLKLTRWNSFEEFIEHLKELGKLLVEETEHGQLIRYVNPFKMPEVKKEIPKLSDEDRRRKELESILKSAKPTSHPEFTDLQEKPNISIQLAAKHTPKISTPSIFTSEIEKVMPPNKKLGMLDELFKEEDKEEAKSWCMAGIAVRVIDSSSTLSNMKAVVQGSFGDKVMIRVISTGETIEVHEKQLETVIPVPGSEIMILKGKFRGTKGRLIRVRPEEFAVDAEIRGRTHTLGYDYISKLS